jgi:hypothetical protein
VAWSSALVRVLGSGASRAGDVGAGRDGPSSARAGAAWSRRRRMRSPWRWARPQARCRSCTRRNSSRSGE